MLSLLKDWFSMKKSGPFDYMSETKLSMLHTYLYIFLYIYLLTCHNMSRIHFLLRQIMIFMSLLTKFDGYFPILGKTLLALAFGKFLALHQDSDSCWSSVEFLNSFSMKSRRTYLLTSLIYYLFPHWDTKAAYIIIFTSTLSSKQACEVD